MWLCIWFDLFFFFYFQNLAGPVPFHGLCPRFSHGAVMNLGLAVSCSLTSLEMSRRTSWNCVIRQGDSCCAYLINPNWHHFSCSGELALLCYPLVLALSCFEWCLWCLAVCTCSVYYTFFKLLVFFFLPFKDLRKKLCHCLFFLPYLFAFYFASTGKSFCHLFSLPRIRLLPNCINICPLRVSPSTPAASAHFPHIFSISSVLLLVCLACLCSAQSVSSGCWVSRCRPPGFSDTRQHTKASRFQLQSAWTLEQDMCCHIFPRCCQTL